MNVLFVCSMARLRSKTAYSLALGSHIEKDYCGTDADADRPVTKSMVEWADKIICMESCHKSKLRRKYRGYSHKMQVWDIPDEYEYSDDVLIMLIRRKSDKELL
jgi:predicted protein tyrosine phosphatase